MPYNAISDLPQNVQDNLTPEEQARWLAVFNAVFDQTQDDEKALLAAWGAVRKGRTASAARSIAVQRDGDTVIVKGWGMKFTGPWDPDLYGEHFSTLTSLLADFYTDAPLWYEHGMDTDYGWHPIGKRHAVQIFGFGVWAEHELFTDHPLFERTMQEVAEGKLAYSSDSIAHYVEQGFNMAKGELRAWPLAGWSLTASPAEPGLGPVTLAGLDATIREVAVAPSKRYPLDEGRAYVTVTACKSVIQPSGATAAPGESNETDTPEAREAQGGAGLDVNAGDVPPEPSDAAPAGSAAKQDLIPTEIQEDDEGENLMDPEYLAMLADFLGVNATPEDVTAALQDLIALLQGQGEEGAAVPVDAESLRSALDLGEDANNAAVVERLTDLMVLLNAQQPEGGRSLNYGALRNARRHYDAMADRTPAGPPAPYYVPGADSNDGDYDAPPPQRNGGARPARSRSLYAPNINTGRAKPPSLDDAVLAALNVKPQGFKGRISDIRARLFQLDRAAKAESGDGALGGWVLNRQIAADILEPLTSKLVLFEAGATKVEMDGFDSITLRKMSSGPEAYWAAENTALDSDDARYASATLTLKELRSLTSVPNKMLRNMASGAESMLRTQMETAMRRKFERDALLGPGGVPEDGGSTGAAPLGVRYTNGITVTALSPERVLQINDLAVAVAALEDADVEEDESWGWISCPRTFRTFEFMRDENGSPILRESWAGGVLQERTLVNHNYFKTTNVPRNLGNGTATDLFLGAWRHMLIGVGMDVELHVSEHAQFTSNATAIMAVAYLDSVIAYPEAFHVHTGVL